MESNAEPIKINGPYKAGRRYRVAIDRGGGTSRTRVYHSFATEALADAFIAGARDQAAGETIQAAVNAFIQAKRDKGLEDASVDSAEDRLLMLLGGVLKRPIHYVASRGEQLYKTAWTYPAGHKWEGQARAAATHQSALAVAKDFGAFCVRRRWLRTNPFQDVAPHGKAIVGADKSRHTVDEARKLYAWCATRTVMLTPAGEWVALPLEQIDRDALLTLSYLLLGNRASEMINRSVRDLDDNGSLLWINRTKTRAGTRKLVIPGELRAPLLAIAADRPSEAPLFARQEGELAGKAWSRTMAYGAVKRCCRAAGVLVLSPQALRRTQSSMATEAGETGLAVARHLGHATGAAPAVTHSAYVDRSAARNAQVERSLRVIAGGKR